MAQLIKKGKFYRGHGELKVKATRDEYLSENNDLRFDAMVLNANENYADTEQIISFKCSVFSEIPEPTERIFDRAIKFWGERSQLEMLQEEATELALSTRKFIRVQNDKTRMDLLGEIADVEIMIKQYEQMNPYDRDVIEYIKANKIKRLSGRLDRLSFE